MADIEKVDPARPVWPRRPDEHPRRRRREEEEDSKGSENDAEEQHDDGRSEDGHVDVFVSD